MRRWGGCVALAVAALLGTAEWAAAQEVGTAARVNGTGISLFRLERHFEDYLKAQGRNVGAIRNPSVFKRLKREALDQLIDKALLREEAARRGIVVDDAAVREARAAVEKGFRTPEAFTRRINEAGFDPAGYDDYLRGEIAASRALAALTGEIEVPEADVRAMYEQHRDRFQRPELVRARHILLRAPPDGDADPAVLARIGELLREIRAGADFAEMARLHSQDGSAGRGGDLGLFPRGRMVPPFEQAAFALTPGAVSEPVRSEFGWHLILVEEHLSADAVPEAEALALVRPQLLAARRAEAVEAALQALRTAASIEVMAGL